MGKIKVVVFLASCILATSSIAQGSKSTRLDRLNAEVSAEFGNDQNKVESVMSEINRVKVQEGIRVLSSVDWSNHKKEENRLNELLATANAEQQRVIKEALIELNTIEMSYADFKLKYLKDE